MKYAREGSCYGYIKKLFTYKVYCLTKSIEALAQIDF